MKKTLVLAVILVMALSTAAFARGHFGGHNGGMGNGMGGCYFNNNDGGHFNGGGYGMGMGMDNVPTDSAVKSEKEAEALVQSYLTENYKGYKIAQTESFSAPRGTAYKVTVNDASGNAFVFHVNPWGSVRGPFLSK